MEQILEFTNNHLLLTSALLGSLFLVLFTEYRLLSRRGFDLTVAQAVALINNDAAVIDIRSPENFSKGHIAGARNLTADQVNNSEERLSALKGSKVLVACDTGMQCGRVVSELRKKGYQDVYSLKGGIHAWQQDKMPLVAKDKSRKGKSKKGKKS